MSKRQYCKEPFENDCEFYCAEKENCKILKKLYCKIEPDKLCAWYKPKELNKE